MYVSIFYFPEKNSAIYVQHLIVTFLYIFQLWEDMWMHAFLSRGLQRHENASRMDYHRCRYLCINDWILWHATHQEKGTPFSTYAFGVVYCCFGQRIWWKWHYAHSGPKENWQLLPWSLGVLSLTYYTAGEMMWRGLGLLGKRVKPSWYHP